MGEHYTHLTWRERLKIEARLKDDWKPQKIADIPDIAQEKYEATFSGKGPLLKIGHNHKLANYLEEVLKDGYGSPEAALGEIEAKGMRFDTKISPQTWSGHVYARGKSGQRSITAIRTAPARGAPAKNRRRFVKEEFHQVKLLPQSGIYLTPHVMIRKTNNQQVHSFFPAHPFPVP